MISLPLFRRSGFTFGSQEKFVKSCLSLPGPVRSSRVYSDEVSSVKPYPASTYCEDVEREFVPQLKSFKRTGTSDLF